MAWWENLIYIAAAEKLWESCPTQAAGSAFQRAGKMVFVLTCGNGFTRHLYQFAEFAEQQKKLFKFDRDINVLDPIWRLEYRPPFKSDIHVKAISSTLLKG